MHRQINKQNYISGGAGRRTNYGDLHYAVTWPTITQPLLGLNISLSTLLSNTLCVSPLMWETRRHIHTNRYVKCWWDFRFSQRRVWRWLSVFCVVVYRHRPKDGGSKYLWNVGKLLTSYTEQQPRRKNFIQFFLAVHNMKLSREDCICLPVHSFHPRPKNLTAVRCTRGLQSFSSDDFFVVCTGLIKFTRYTELKSEHQHF
jgi:hypothetical protein